MYRLLMTLCAALVLACGPLEDPTEQPGPPTPSTPSQPTSTKERYSCERMANCPGVVATWQPSGVWCAEDAAEAQRMDAQQYPCGTSCQCSTRCTIFSSKC